MRAAITREMPKGRRLTKTGMKSNGDYIRRHDDGKKDLKHTIEPERHRLLRKPQEPVVAVIDRREAWSARLRRVGLWAIALMLVVLDDPLNELLIIGGAAALWRVLEDGLAMTWGLFEASVDADRGQDLVVEVAAQGLD